MRPPFFVRVGAAALALLLLASLPAAAAPERLGRFGSWSAYRLADESPVRCYVAGAPAKSEGQYTRRGDVYAFLDVRRGEDGPGAVSFQAGYRFQEGGEAAVEVADQGRFSLYTEDEIAWSFAGDDAKIVEAMRRGLTMVVKGVSWRGTETTDTYDLRGFTAASDAAREACAG